jgi:hypothetical protein
MLAGVAHCLPAPERIAIVRAPVVIFLVLLVARDAARGQQRSGNETMRSRELAASVNAGIDQRIARQKDAAFDGAASKIYTATDDSKPSYTRNPGVWLTNCDLTCIPVYSDTATGPSYVGCLVSPDIVVEANHRHPDACNLRFVTARNRVETRKLRGGMQLEGTDIWVGVLDRPVPNAIRPAKLLPADYAKYLPASGDSIAVVYANQFRTIRIAEWKPKNSSPATEWEFVKPTAANRAAWWGDVADPKTTAVAYDSGSAIVMVVNDQPVFLATFHGPNSGPGVADHLSELAAAIQKLGGQHFETADLRKYPTH